MAALTIMLKNVVLFVLLAIPGFLLVKTKVLTSKESGTLSKLLTYVALPFMVFNSTLNVTLTKDFALSALLIAVIGAVFTLATVALTALFTAKEKDTKRRGMLRFSMALANNGFLGIPLANAVFGPSDETTYLVILNIVTNLMLFTVGIYLVSGDKKTISLKKVATNPVLLAFVLGVILNLLKVPTHLPEVKEYAGYFGGIVTALSMTVLGMKMADVKLSALFLKPRTYGVSAVRLILFPVAGLSLMFLLQLFLPITNEMILGFFVAFAMPTAGLATTFADQYNGDAESAVALTLGSTLLSVVTIPVLYWALCTLLG